MARKKAKSEAKSEAPKKIKPISLNILEIAKRLQKIEQTSGGGDTSALANKSDIATEFNTTTAYTAGCFVYHEGTLYQFNADHSAGAWDPTEAVVSNVTDQVVSNKSAIDGLTASDVSYDNTTSGLSATNVQGAIDELATTPRGYEVIATFTGDGVKTYADVITAFLPYTNQADLFIDAINTYYPRNTDVYFSINISGSGSVVIYVIRFDATNPYWKTIAVSNGAESDYLAQVVPSQREIKLCKKL